MRCDITSYKLSGDQLRLTRIVLLWMKRNFSRVKTQQLGEHWTREEVGKSAFNQEKQKAEPPLSKAARLSFRPVAFRPCLPTGLALSCAVSIHLD